MDDSNRRLGSLDLRYEDLAQTGQLLLEAITASLGTVWESRLEKHPMTAWCASRHILPILTRIKATAFEGPFALENEVQVEGDVEIARSLDAQGATRRLMMLIETRLTAPKGRTNLPAPEGAGTPATAGEVIAEHGVPTDARPGRLVRGRQSAPA